MNTKNIISNCKFSNISSTNGAIYLYFPSDLEISDSIFYRNSAITGTAIYLFFESTNQQINFKLNLFSLDIINSHRIVLKSNNFNENIAFVCIIYVSNLQSNVTIQFLSNILKNNNITYTKSGYKNGAMVYLENPGSMIITNCFFHNNSGFSGTSIYYFEIQTNFNIILNNNTFENNFAEHGAAGIYFSNKFEQIDPLKNNSFKNNVGFDVESPPFKFSLNTSNLYFNKKSRISLNLVPGFSTLSLYFKILDYYGHYISYYNGSMVKMQIRNQDFSINTDNSITITGITLVSIFNGNLKLNIIINLWK